MSEPTDKQRGRPDNFVAEVNGHHIYRGDNGKFNLWTPGTGWWGFELPEANARRICEIVVKGGTHDRL